MGITLLPDLTRSDSVLTRQAGLTERNTRIFPKNRSIPLSAHRKSARTDLFWSLSKKCPDGCEQQKLF